MLDEGNHLDNIARVKEAIVLHGGVMASISVWSDFKAYPWGNGSSSGDAAKQAISVYSTNRPPAKDVSRPENLHAVFCFGWKDSSTGSSDQAAHQSSSVLGFLTCKNSWGTEWGENGTFKIAYGAANLMQLDSTYAMRFDKHSRAQDAAELLNKNSIAVTDPDYPGCWLFTPPRPMRLLHVAEELDCISRSLNATSFAKDAEAPRPLPQHAASPIDVSQQRPISKVQILQDLILSNLLYTGVVTPAKILTESNTPEAGPSSILLTALIGHTGPHGTLTAAAGTPPGSFLICNSTAGMVPLAYLHLCTFGTLHCARCDVISALMNIIY
jgi:hypothetical protein